MVLAAIKENKETMLPTLSERDTSFQKFMKAIMTTPSVKCDPLQSDTDMDVSPDINPKNVLRIRTHRLVDRNHKDLDQTEEDCQREQYGGKTLFEMILDKMYMAESYAETSALIITTSRPAITVPPGHTAGPKETGRDGKSYTRVYDEKGNLAYIEGQNMCMAPKGGLAATTSARTNDDLIDSDQAFRITYKFDKDGNKVERTAAEADFELAMVRMENDFIKAPLQLNMIERITAQVSADAAGVPHTQFTSLANSGIKSDAKPTGSFGEAATGIEAPAPQKSVVFRTDAPELPSWAKKQEPRNEMALAPTPP